MGCSSDIPEEPLAKSSETAVPADVGSMFHVRHLDEPVMPVLLAVPHGGRRYADAITSDMRNPQSAKMRLEDRYVDTLATFIANETRVPSLVAEAPRAVIDLNRSKDDVDWSMVSGIKGEKAPHSLSNRRARSGLGLVPRRLSGLGEIWRSPLRIDELERRIDSIHRPYHVQLSKALERIRDKWGVAVLLDLHSMPPLKKRFPEDLAPEFVIGDRFGSSCDHRLTSGALNWFAANGRRASHNRPYSGGYVLDRHTAPVRGVHGLQLEVCRSLYLDNQLDQPSARMPSIARLLTGFVRYLASEATSMVSSAGLRTAAE